MATARKKSLKDIQAQYDRILAGDKQYMQPDENGMLQGRSARTQRAAEIMQRYMSNIRKTSAYQKDADHDGKIWRAYVDSGFKGDRNALDDQTKFNRKYSQRTYMGKSVG